MYQVVFYETARGRGPVQDFLDGRCTHHQRAKVAHALTLLAEAGFRLGPPWLKKVGKDIWELRVWADRARLRILFCQDGRDLVLLHALKKQADRLPNKDLEVARQRCRDWTT
jgi:phage-related protein